MGAVPKVCGTTSVWTIPACVLPLASHGESDALTFKELKWNWALKTMTCPLQPPVLFLFSLTVFSVLLRLDAQRHPRRAMCSCTREFFSPPAQKKHTQTDTTTGAKPEHNPGLNHHSSTLHVCFRVLYKCQGAVSEVNPGYPFHHPQSFKFCLKLNRSHKLCYKIDLFLCSQLTVGKRNCYVN